MAATRLQKSGLEAIRLLRKTKHAKGLPFMINSNTLASHQCYFEYPDGSMKVVQANSSKTDFVVISDVDPRFATYLRKKLKLI